MKKVVLILMLIVSALFLLPFSSFSMDIGMNLNSVSDWSTDHVFLDVFKRQELGVHKISMTPVHGIQNFLMIFPKILTGGRFKCLFYPRDQRFLRQFIHW